MSQQQQQQQQQPPQQQQQPLDNLLKDKQQPQHPLPLPAGGFDPLAQQQLLQQLAQRFPAAAAAAANPAAANNSVTFPNLGSLQLPQARKPSAGSPSANTANVASPSAPSPAAGGADLSSLHAQLQARMLQAQQQALQAAALRASQGAGSSAAGIAQPSPSASTSSLPTPQQKPPNGLPDWASAAAANGMLGSIQGGDREAIMKQLQALQASHQQRTKHASNLASNASPVAGATSSPASVTAPSPATVTAPSPAPNPLATPSSAQPSLPTADALAGQSPSIAAMLGAIRPPAPGAQPQAASSSGLAAAGAAQARPPPGRQPAVQRQQFLNSVLAFYKSQNQSPPPQVFNNAGHPGSFQLGDAWIDLADLFFAVFRLGGMLKLMQNSQNPTEHPVWQAILQSKGIPATLATPQPVPRPPGADTSTPAPQITNAVHFLVAAYRAWLFNFEQAMTRQKLAHLQKQQQLAAAGGVRPPLAGSPIGNPPTPTTFAASPVAAMSPAYAQSPAVTAPSPAVAASPAALLQPLGGDSAMGVGGSAALTAATTDVSATPAAPNAAAPPSAAAPATPATTTPASAATPGAPVGPTAPVPPTPQTEDSPRPTSANGTPSSVNGIKKRKRDLQDAKGTASTPGSSVSPAPASPAKSQQPKRPRYKVEYRPLHFPQPTLGGWDERVILSAMSKHNLSRPTRSPHELRVDIEAVLMGLRSRLPREVAYAMTVLSMLSMPIHEGNVGSLPIQPLNDVYLEVIDLIGESALGEGGLEAWLKPTETSEEPSAESSSRDHLSRLSNVDLERLGNDVDFVVEDADAPIGKKEQTGGATDIILTGLNIIRNFSYTPDNQHAMARPELLHMLAAISDMSLVRLPGSGDTTNPYSILEIARVRREVVAILTNLGTSFDLRRVSPKATISIFRVISSFLTSGWEALRQREPGYGPSVSIRETAPSAVLSVDRALAAFSSLALSDYNREVLAAVMPAEELVELFSSLVKLFPLTQREVEAMLSIEDYLGRVELVALSVYSLAFLAPPQVRGQMRATPGATSILTRLVCDLTPRSPNLRQSPFGILVGRIAETLGVLNGSVTPGGNAEGMSFSAGGVDGKGWKFASDVVEPGWLAHDADRVLSAMGWGTGDGRIWRVDGTTFSELDALWSE